jgi:predicted site-specific integrase-resolvase
MKLSTFARRAGSCYKTAWRWWKTGKIKGYQTETGTVIITEEMSEQPGRNALLSQIGVRQAGKVLRRRIYDAIAKAYPEYA